jgi:hypothetical protein
MKDLLARNEARPPSFAVHLHPDYWTLNNGSKFLYNNQIAVCFSLPSYSSERAKSKLNSLCSMTYALIVFQLTFSTYSMRQRFLSMMVSAPLAIFLSILFKVVQFQAV